MHAWTKNIQAWSCLMQDLDMRLTEETMSSAVLHKSSNMNQYQGDFMQQYRFMQLGVSCYRISPWLAHFTWHFAKTCSRACRILSWKSRVIYVFSAPVSFLYMSLLCSIRMRRIRLCFWHICYTASAGTGKHTTPFSSWLARSRSSWYGLKQP